MSHSRERWLFLSASVWYYPVIHMLYNTVFGEYKVQHGCQIPASQPAVKTVHMFISGQMTLTWFTPHAGCYQIYLKA